LTLIVVIFLRTPRVNMVLDGITDSKVIREALETSKKLLTKTKKCFDDWWADVSQKDPVLEPFAGYTNISMFKFALFTTLALEMEEAELEVFVRFKCLENGKKRVFLVAKYIKSRSKNSPEKS